MLILKINFYRLCYKFLRKSYDSLWLEVAVDAVDFLLHLLNYGYMGCFQNIRSTNKMSNRVNHYLTFLASMNFKKLLPNNMPILCH